MKRQKQRRLISSRRLILIGALLVIGAFIGSLLTHNADCKYYICNPYINMVIRVLSSLFILMLSWLLISVSYKYIRRGRVVITCFVAIYVLGIFINNDSHTYGSKGNVDTSTITDVLAPINSTLSVFFPSRGAYSEVNNRHHDAIYHIYHLLSYLFVSAFLFSLLGRRLLNRSWHLFYPERDKNIFWGYSENGRTLAENFQNETLSHKAIFILNSNSNDTEVDDNYIFNKINRIGAVALYDDYSNINPHARRYTACRHFFMSEDQDFNVKMALNLLDKFIPEKMNGERVHLYIRTELENVDTFFINKIKVRGLKGKVDVTLYNHSDLTARLFVEANPIISHKAITVNSNSCTVSGRMNVLIIGLGWTGYEILRKTVCDAQYMGDDYSFSVTAIDKDFETLHGRDKYTFKDANEHTCGKITINPTYDGEPVNAANGDRFYDWLNHNNNILSFDRIIITLGDDELNINTALQIDRFRMEYQSCENQFEKIFAHVRDFEKYKYFQEGDGSLITVFGDLCIANSCKVMINTEKDIVGMMVNFVYNEHKVKLFSKEQFAEKVNSWGGIESQWLETTEFNKDSSRAVAMNLKNIITLAGGIEGLKEILGEEGEKLEVLAETEHLRWNAFHYMHGVRKWELEEVTTANGKLRRNGVLVKHIALRRYSELDEASAVINRINGAESDEGEDYKETDRRILRHFPYFDEYKNHQPKRESKIVKLESYTPKPKDTSKVELPKELDGLREAVAKNVHEVWASGRVSEGWRWGVSRNDFSKKHPNIVPYEKLSESDKDYDRRTSEETLKFILSEGFKIEKKEN